MTELIYALDAQSQLVGVDVTSVTPKESPLPKVGYHRALSAEGLIALEPTIVIGSDEMGPKPALDQLERIGVDIEIVDTAPTVEGLNTRIDQIAKLTNTEANAPALKFNIAKQVNALTSNQPQEHEAKKVLFLLIHEGRPANVAGNETTPDAIIKLAGGINLQRRLSTLISRSQTKPSSKCNLMSFLLAEEVMQNSVAAMRYSKPCQCSQRLQQDKTMPS
ncbi:periplasmic hemin-binding protein [Vibrio maritimus]|uniref:Periplasmic hemin-binding protein n=1 Tax=Vibrio maritimus TaxID=990268 RepID=A0A090RR40_9VIBR|nr:periplasmic hemin-binding protein [Vibrio maritimus]